MFPCNGSDDNYNDALSACSDSELIVKCRENGISSPYETELLYRYYAFIKKKAAAFCGTPSSCDDFVQEGILGFMSAVRAYDPERGNPFSVFACTCIVNRMKNAAARMRRLTESEDDGDITEAEDNITPESIILGRELMDRIRELLTPLEYSVLSLHSAGLECRDIAVKLGIERKSADNALFRARKKLLSELEN